MELHNFRGEHTWKGCNRVFWFQGRTDVSITYYILRSDRMHSDRGLKGVPRVVSHGTVLSAVTFSSQHF
jgi:hypothetical protein